MVESFGDYMIRVAVPIVSGTVAIGVIRGMVWPEIICAGLGLLALIILSAAVHRIAATYGGKLGEYLARPR